MLNYLLDLKSALDSISTKGNDTIIMGRCLESLNYQIENLKQQGQQKQIEEE